MDEFLVLALMAESGHGKNFSGDWIIENKGFVGVAFADPIKRLCRHVLSEFSDEALWGDASLRNQPIKIDWRAAEYRFLWHVDDWIMQLKNLSVEERAEYKLVVQNWFTRIEKMAVDDALAPRVALQLLGTEYGRSFRKNIWASYLMSEIVPLIATGAEYDRTFGIKGPIANTSKWPKGVIITDCRYLNEMEEVQKHNGSVIKIVRNSLKGKANEAEQAGIKGHSSEVEMRDIPDDKYNLVLEMDDGADNVYPRLKKMFDEHEYRPK